jgi:hypothetical protein
MKLFFFLFLNFHTILGQVPGAVVQPATAQPLLDEPTFCLLGNVATLPSRSLVCSNPNEVFACGYGEARCDGLGFCGTVESVLICVWLK